MKHWQVLVLPLLLVANYFFMVCRHEGCHALVVWWTGGHLVDFHVWPPAHWNLSWIVEAPRVRSPGVLQLQAALPHLVSLGFVFAGLYYLSSVTALTATAYNVLVTAVVFPLVDLTLSVGGYWFVDNDYGFIFGPGHFVMRATLTAWLTTVLLLAALVVVRITRGRASSTAKILRASVMHVRS